MPDAPGRVRPPCRRGVRGGLLAFSVAVWLALAAGGNGAGIGGPVTALAQDDAADAPAPPPPVAVAWRDPETLKAATDEAVAAVQDECGAQFKRRPSVRVSTATECADALLAIEASLDLMPKASRAAAETTARFLLAFCDYTTGIVHVLPDNAERISREHRAPALVSGDVLRVLLFHEVTHALDWERFDWITYRKQIKGQDQVQAFSAVAEGHAQLVAEDVAAARGLSDAFATLTRGIVDLPPDLPPATRVLAKVAAAEATFGYVAGHRFMRAVRDARGRDGVEAVLKDPPRDTRGIEDPLAFLAGTAGPGPDLEVVVSAFGHLVADAKWTTQRDRARAAMLSSQRSRLPADRRADYLRGYEDGAVATSRGPGQAQVAVLVGRFATEDDARRYIEDDRAMGRAGEAGAAAMGVTVLSSEVADDLHGDGGVADPINGFRYDKRLKQGDTEVRVSGATARFGRLVASVVAIQAPWVDAAALRTACARFVLVARDPAAAAQAPPLPALAVPDAPK